MMPESSECADILQDAVANQDICHVLSLSNVDNRTWHRKLQDDLLNEANNAKVNLTSCVATDKNCMTVHVDCYLRHTNLVFVSWTFFSGASWARSLKGNTHTV